MSPSPYSRARGAIWGTCVGDALGGPVQKSKAGTFNRITDLEYIAPFNKPPGSYSDDGSMTLAFAASFIKSGGRYDHLQSIKNYIAWHEKGSFSSDWQTWDVGRSTGKALGIWKNEWPRKGLASTQNIINAELGAASGRSSQGKPMGAGNGSLMRITPVGVAFCNNIARAKQVARQQSMITHPSIICIDACEAYTYLICLVMQGRNKENLCKAIAGFRFQSPELRGRLTKYPNIQSWKDTTEDQITSSGKVDDTLETALWGFFKYDSWEEGALAVVNRGGDSDTAGAVYGSLAGAFYGHRSIPKKFTDKMMRRDFISNVAHDFAETLFPSPGGQLSQQGRLSQQGHLPQQSHLSQQGWRPQQSNLPQQGRLPQQGHLPQQNHLSQQGWRPQQSNPPQQGRLSQQGFALGRKGKKGTMKTFSSKG